MNIYCPLPFRGGRCFFLHLSNVMRNWRSSKYSYQTSQAVCCLFWVQIMPEFSVHPIRGWYRTIPPPIERFFFLSLPCDVLSYAKNARRPPCPNGTFLSTSFNLPLSKRISKSPLFRSEGVFFCIVSIIFFPRGRRDSNLREDLEVYTTSTYRYYYTRFVHTIRYYYAVGSQCTPSLDQTGYIAQHRNVAPCGAVRCRAVPFAAVPCRAALCAFFRT